MGQSHSSRQRINPSTQIVNVSSDLTENSAELQSHIASSEERKIKDFTVKIPSDGEREDLRKLCSCISKVKIYDDGDYLDFPFLKEIKTIQYISESKVMFIMRGLPGSGKSTIVKCLTKVYQNSAVCSADQYFIKDGVYEFDVNQLKEAHEACKRSAISAAENQTPVIIVDNTNIQFWEMKFYIDLSRAFHYACVVVEPKTPWTRKPDVLSEKNSHGVDQDVIRKKLKNLKPLYPIYYGWFLNESDSALLQQMAHSWLQRMLMEPKIFEEFSKHTKLKNIEDMLEHYDKGRYSLNKLRIIHCTSKFTANRDEPGVMEYIEHPVVQQSLSTVHRLSVVGYVITPRTLGARIRLTSRQLTLWGGDDVQMDPKGSPGRPTSTQSSSRPASTQTNKNLTKGKSRSRYKGPPNSNEVPIPPYTVEFGEMTPTATLAVVPQEPNCDRFHPTSGKGSRAHFTLGTAEEVSPVTTGSDLLKVVELESQLGEDQGRQVSGVSFSSYNIPGAVVRGYGNGILALYPDKKAEMDSLFGCFL